MRNLDLELQGLELSGFGFQIAFGLGTCVYNSFWMPGDLFSWRGAQRRSFENDFSSSQRRSAPVVASPACLFI